MGKVVTISFLLISLSFYSVNTSLSQNLIGVHKDDIKKDIKTTYPGFVFEKEISNGNKSFIKFVNTFEEQTLLFVTNEKGYCTSISRMYNTWLFNRVNEELNAKYQKTDSLTWMESIGNEKFEIKLIRGEWFLTVITRPYSNKK